MNRDVVFSFHATQRLRQRLKQKFKGINAHNKIGLYMNYIINRVKNIKMNIVKPFKFRYGDFHVVCVDQGKTRLIVTVMFNKTIK